jgi:transposase
MQPTHEIDVKATVVVSLELSGKSWRIAATDGRRERPAQHRFESTGAQERLEELKQCIDQLKLKWRLSDCEIALIYEAGQDGFWIERALRALGCKVWVVDAASVPVARQAKRAKTDRLDALSLLKVLQDWLRGERGRVRMVYVPAPEAEARRHLARERGLLQKEIGQHRDRMRKLLRLEGCWIEAGDEHSFEHPESLRRWDGTPLPGEMLQRLQREQQRLKLVQQQMEELQTTMIEQLPEPIRKRIHLLQGLKGIGETGAMRLVLELFWRDFDNRRQVGSCVGLVPQPYDSGGSRVDQGISKQGNRRVRSLLIELAWLWLRWQPQSQIAKWFVQRTGAAGKGVNKRGKRVAIVAVARRLVIALWRFLVDGTEPAGATLKRRAATKTTQRSGRAEAADCRIGLPTSVLDGGQRQGFATPGFARP